MTRKLRVLDLFSGIGGFSLGLERTGGFETVAFCEIDRTCRRILAKHWPDVPVIPDIHTLKGTDVGPVHVVCGGFPCQPFSSAARGRSVGTDDHRYLWPEMLRVIAEARPAWVIGENVAGLDRVALEQVVSDLEGEFYSVQTFEIPACAVGHDHRRTRIWVIGHTNHQGQSGRPFDGEVARLPWHRNDAGSMGAPNGIPGRMDRLRALGNAVVPQIPEMIGRAILAVEAAE